MRKRIDIACFTGTSGLTDYSVSLARELAKTCHVCLVTAQSLPERFRALNFETRLDFRRTRHFLQDFPRFVRRTLRDPPSALLFQAPLKYPLVEGLAVSLFRAAGIRTALTIHDVLPHYPAPWSEAEYRWFYRRFDRLIVHSEAAREAVREMKVDRPMRVVPHGPYDLFRLTDMTRKDARRNIGVDPDDCVILFFGHLEPRKGVLEFLEAAERSRHQARLRFVVAGSSEGASSGPALRAALDRARDFGNVLIRDERIPFEEVESYFAASDVVALPYREGTTSGVLKLAVAFGVPVIASRIGDLPYEVPAGAGILIEPGHRMADQLVEALLQIGTELDSRTAAMRAASDVQSWQSVAAAYAEFLLA
jgi:glycosyltransferase involved in cell wall biosynthesis